jgi:formylglycine-generating enzyme required for sulfatase activity
MLYSVVATITSTPRSNMFLIPAGSFMMGNATSVFPTEEDQVYQELPQRSVYASAFYMDKYEVTKALWDTDQDFTTV